MPYNRVNMENHMEQQDRSVKNEFGSFAEQLRHESDKLRQLAEELGAREREQAEMRANYPLLKRAVYALLREKFVRELPLPPDKDLETLAIEEGAQPLNAFIDELDRLAEGRSDGR
jgi:hypothetical protein